MEPDDCQIFFDRLEEFCESKGVNISFEKFDERWHVGTFLNNVVGSGAGVSEAKTILCDGETLWGEACPLQTLFHGAPCVDDGVRTFASILKDGLLPGEAFPIGTFSVSDFAVCQELGYGANGFIFQFGFTGTVMMQAASSKLIASGLAGPGDGFAWQVLRNPYKRAATPSKRLPGVPRTAYK